MDWYIFSIGVIFGASLTHFIYRDQIKTYEKKLARARRLYRNIKTYRSAAKLCLRGAKDESKLQH